MRRSKPKTAGVIVFAVFCAICGYMANTVFAFDAEIEMYKNNLATVEEYEHLKSIVPAEYHQYLNSLINAVRSGKDAYYDVHMWLDDTEDEGIIAASLTTPNMKTFNLVRDYEESYVQFELPDEVEDIDYFSISDLTVDFPPGEYTLYITLDDHSTITAKATLPNYDGSSFPDFVDGSCAPGPGNVLQLHWSTVQSDNEYEIWVVNLNKFDDVFDSGNIYVAHPQALDTTLTGAVAGKSDYEIGICTEQDFTSGVFHFELDSQRSWFIFKKPLVAVQNLVKQCSVKAGKVPGQDSILIIGQIDAIEADLHDATEIKVTIDSNDMNEQIVSFPIDAISLKKGKYNYSRKENASTKKFTFDCKTKKFTFMAKNVDLTGLWCPFSVKIEIGAYVAEMTVDEDIANGPKKSIPIQLMMGVKDVLRVDSFKVKFGKTDFSDSLSVEGVFTVKDDIDKNNPLIVLLGSQTFTIASNKFATKGYVESCKTDANEGGNVSASFDFAKCTFSIDIKNTNITDYGLVDFGVNIFGIHILSSDQIDLGPQRIFGLEELRMYNSLGSQWTYNADYSYTAKMPGETLTDSDLVTGILSVSDTNENFNGHSCYEVAVSVSGSDIDPYYTYWYTDTDGIHWAGLEAGAGNLGYIVESDLAFPHSIVVGRDYTDSGPFSGELWLDVNPSIDFVFSDLHGTASHYIKLIGNEEITVPYGTYDAIKGEYSSETKGTMRVTIDAFGEHYEGKGTFTTACEQTFWAVPGVGFIAVDSYMQTKLSMSGIGSITVTITEYDSLTDYFD